ncbi:hypothetical protein [Pararhizobium haloflavum]|uniref:hypothetical protein n=1 Tax=Pararhizobium haloflavum TaxID=2037914 RepID=UPI001FE1134C|nr:hypothetical protein [Pararhizobium haloflavum]
MTSILRRGSEDVPLSSIEGPDLASAAISEAGTYPPVRLPSRIPGGLKGVTDDLERHARDWRNTYRMLEHQRPLLEAAEIERDRLHDTLSRIVPRVHDANRGLVASMEMAKKGDFSGDLSGQFARSLTALDELEGIAEALTSNLLQMRATWEQYARTVIRAQKQRDELKPGMA